MPESFAAAEFRLVQERAEVSGANWLELAFTSLVPAGKIWTVIAFGYKPSVAETKTISIGKYTRSGAEMAIMNPVSLALNPMVCTPLEQNAFIDLLPGEGLTVRRDSATAGSTMSVTMQYIEWDMPLYDYIEPQEAARIKRATVATMAERIRTAVGGGGGRSARGVMGGARGSMPSRPK